MKINRRITLGMTLISLILSAASPVIHEVSGGGPATSNLLIRIYSDLAQEGNALDKGDIDMNDWPLSQIFLSQWATRPDISMNDYVSLDMFTIDMNNQLWPTGPITSPRSGAKNGFFDPGGLRDIAALHFRRAIAHLTNKAKHVAAFLGGMGYVLSTPVPLPALEGLTDYSTLTNSTAVADAGPGGYTYPYDRASAINELELGGFHDWDGDTYREWSGDEGLTYEEMPNMKFWIRSDDPPREQAAEDLYNEMLAIGIPQTLSYNAPGLYKRKADRSTCFSSVMVTYDYNFYSGNWGDDAPLDFNVDFLYNLYASPFGQYACASNYPGFKNHDFDAYAAKVKYPGNLEAVRSAAIQAQWVLTKYVPIIPLWSYKAVKAYRTGWTGVVNKAGWGIDNSYSLHGMLWNDGLGNSRNGPSNSIVYGFSSDITSLNAFTSQALCDWKVLNSMYDRLLDRNPFNLQDKVGLLASSWSVVSSYPGWTGKSVAEFTLRTDATFHDGSPVKPSDVAYSILAVRDAGAGNALNYPNVMDVNKIEIQGQVVRVFFNVESAFAADWVGFLPIINKDLWDDAIGVGTAAGYTGFIPDNTNGVYLPGTYTDPTAVRAYHPWESTAAGNPAINDLAEDGGFVYSFVSYNPGNNIVLSAFSQYYTTISWHGMQTTFGDFIPKAFHGIGNVNYPGGYGATQGWYVADDKIDNYDIAIVKLALGTISSDPWGFGQWLYNPDADINGNNIVDIIDLSTVGSNARYGGETTTSGIAPRRTIVAQGENLAIDVTISGSSIDAFKVIAYYGTATITPDEWDTFWSMGDVNRDGYIDNTDGDLITAALDTTTSDAFWNPNADLNQDQYVDYADWDIWNSNIGSSIWSYFMSGAVIGTQTIFRLYGTCNVEFIWDTASVPYGDHIISAYSVPASSESNKADNNYGDGTVTIVKGAVSVYPQIIVGPPPKIGDIFDVNVTVAYVKDLYTWQAGMTFDNSVMEAVSIAEGEFLKRAGVPTLWTPGEIDNANGKISYSACSVTGSTPGVSGDGQLMRVTFRVKGSGSSALILTDILFLDSNLISITPVTVGEGQVKIDVQDLAVTMVSTSATEAYPTWTVPIDITVVVQNQGTRTETFDVTVYANAIAIETKPVTLDAGTTTTLVYNWNLASVTEDTYTIRAEATILYGEIDTADNTMTDGTVVIKHPGDANGDDILNAYDLGILAQAWGTSVGQPLYDPRADFNGDQTIDTLDHDILKAYWP